MKTYPLVAPNLACGKARGASALAPAHTPQRVCNRRATQPQAKFGATLRATVLFRPDFVVRSFHIHCGICRPVRKHLAPASRLTLSSRACFPLALEVGSVQKNGAPRRWSSSEVKPWRCLSRRRIFPSLRHSIQAKWKLDPHCLGLPNGWQSGVSSSALLLKGSRGDVNASAFLGSNYTQNNASKVPKLFEGIRPLISHHH